MTAKIYRLTVGLESPTISPGEAKDLSFPRRKILPRGPQHHRA